MKKITILFLILIVSVQLVDSIVFNLNEDQLKKDQPLIGRIQGVFTNGLSTNNIFFYRGDMKIPFNPVLKKIQDDYYLYTDCEGKSPGNYTIKIQGVSYLQNGKLTNEDIIKNFSISEDIVDFSLSPGIIDTDKDFFITIKNKAEDDLKISVEINKENKNNREILIYDNGETLDKEDITLKIGEIRVLKFVLGNEGQSGFYNLSFKSNSITYDIPVYVLSNPNSYESNKMEWQYSSINFTGLNIKKGNIKIIGLANLESEEIDDVSFSVSDSIKDYVKVLNQSVNLKKGLNEIYLNISSENVGELQGLISALFGQEITSMSLKISFIGENEKPKNKTSEISNTLVENSGIGEAKLRCSDLGGHLCDTEQTCGNGGVKQVSKEDNELQFCCVGGECLNTKTSTNNGNSRLGIILIIILIMIVVVIFFKFKSAKRPIDLLKRKKV
jgi:hypothetical protein